MTRIADGESIAIVRQVSDQEWERLLMPSGTPLDQSKVSKAFKASLKKADDFSDRSIREEQAAVEFISADGGGEYFKAIWVDLIQLSASKSP